MKLNLKWNIRNTAGTFIGALSPLVLVPITIGLIAWAQHFSYIRLWDKMWIDVTVQSKFISLSIIPNLIWFYLFLNKERYDMARGVIIGSAIYLPFILYVNVIR